MSRVVLKGQHKFLGCYDFLAIFFATLLSFTINKFGAVLPLDFKVTIDLMPFQGFLNIF